MPSTAEALKESEGKFREIFNKVNDAIHLHEIEPDGNPGRFIDVNEVACQMLQYSRDEMLQHTPLDFATEYHSRPLEKIVKELKTAGHAVFETGHRRKDGTIVQVEINAHVILFGGKRRVLSVVRDITERKQAEEVLRETNEYLHKLIDYASAPILVWDPRFRITRFNDAFEHLTGRTEQEVIGQPLDILFPEESRDISLALIKKTLEGERWESVKIPILAAEGTIHTVLWNSANILTADAELVSTIAQGVDITQSKRAEDALRESEERYRTLINKLPDYIFVHTKDGVVYVNPAAVQLLGYTKEELLTPPMTRFIAPDSHEIIKNALQQREAEVLDTPHEIVVLTKDGTRRTCLIQGSRIIFNSALSTLIVLTDITERKQAEEELRQSEERLNLAIDGANLGLWDMNLLTGGMVHNRFWAEMLGFSTAELEKPSVWWGERVHPDDYQNVLNFSNLHRAGKVPLFDAVYRMKHKDGSWRWVHSQGKVVARDSDGQPLRMIGINQDITEQKRAEEALQESREFLNKIINSISDPIHVKDRQHRIILINDAACRLFNLSREEIIGKTAYGLFAGKEMADISWQKDEEVFRKGEESVSEETNTYAPGKTLTVLVKKTLYTDTAKNQFLVGITTDITGHKQAEGILRESEERLKEAQRVGHLGSWDLNVVTGDLQWSDECYRIYGFRPQEFVPTYEKFRSIVHPEDLGFVQEQVDAALNNDKHYDVDFRFVRPNGGIGWIHCEGEVRRDAEGKPLRFFGTQIDITGCKRAGETEQQLTEFRESVITNARVWLSVLDQRGKILVWNTAAEEISGYRAEEVIGKNEIWKLLYPQKEYRKHITDTITRIIRDKKYLENFETTIRSRQGNQKVISWNTRGITDATGRISDYIAIGVDVTDRQLAEQMLRVSEEKFRTVLENVPDLILVHRKGIILYINPPATEVMGYTHDELINKQLTDFIVPEYHLLVARAISRRMDGKTVEPYEIEILTKSGGRRTVAVHGTLIEFAGSPASLNVLTDITERKLAEKALRESEEVLRSMLDATPAGVGLLVNRVLQKVNHSLCKITGYSEEEMIGQSTRMLYPDDEEYLRVGRELYEQMEREGLGTVEARLKRKDGAPIIVMLSLSPFDPQNLTAGVTATVLDITERKRAEEALHETEERYRSLFDRSLDCVYIHDFLGNFIDANPSALKLLGYTGEEIKSVKFTSLLNAEQIPLSLQIIQEVITTGTQKESIEYRVRRKDGTYVDVETTATLLYHEGKPYAIQGFAHDITERKKTEEKLKKFNEELERGIAERTARINTSLEEKVVLLREIHHRVKNNLQILISLLNLQSRTITDPQIIVALKESTQRIRAMSMVHEKLYSGSDLAHIDFISYLSSLAKSLVDFYRLGPGKVTLEITGKNIMLDINTAIPLGLVMNELLSNALKHAFPGDRKGTIRIDARETEGRLDISLADDGVGLPEGFDYTTSQSLGLRLVHILIEQLSGTIELKKEKGTTFNIVVKEK